VTELDPTILDRLLPPVPGAPDWEDVMRRSGSRGRHRRRQLVALVAAALLVAAGTASAIGPVRAFFWSARENSRIAYLHDGGLYVMDADGSGQERLARDVGCCVAWSADGRTLAYTVRDNGVWVVRTERSRFGWNKARSKPWRLAPDGRFAAWSPDMWHIAYSAEGGIFVVGVDGSGRRRLVDDGADPVWSPDGRSIAFLRRGDLWVMDADGTGQRNLTDSPLETEAEAQWSPDGRRILFERQAEALDVGTRATRGTTEIVVTTADGGKERRLTSNTAYDGRASWSPDGRRIVFVCGFEDARVCVMNDDGTGRRDLGARTSPDRPVAWSPDGTQIAYTARDGSQVEVMNSDGSDKHRLPRSPTGQVFVAWAPASLFDFRPPPG
jgi:Tol biopolymer transport system component